jgi:hypothetical protein
LQDQDWDGGGTWIVAENLVTWSGLNWFRWRLNDTYFYKRWWVYACDVVSLRNVNRVWEGKLRRRHFSLLIFSVRLTVS